MIPFYWGFREENRQIKKKRTKAHGQWLDAYDNRIDKDGAKDGGPFENASNCLPHMGGGPETRSPGQSGRHPGDADASDLRRAPDRRYQVLAALRLAMLIRIIRKRHPRVAINVVAHSMGLHGVPAGTGLSPG